MKVEFTRDFIKIFKKRFSSKPNIQKRFEERLRKFTKSPADSILADHALSGKLTGHRAFSITGDIIKLCKARHDLDGRNSIFDILIKSSIKLQIFKIPSPQYL